MRAVLNSFRAKESHCPYGLGIQSIARYCNKRGHEVEMNSTRAESLDEGVERILSLKPEVVGLSSNYVTEPHVIDMVRMIKQRRKEVFIVVGGPSVTYSLKESPIRQSDADLFVRGDGERAFCEILEKSPDSFVNGRNKFHGVSNKQDFSEEVASVELDSVPSVFPINFQTDHVYWETVRGCAFSCIYCAHPGQKNQFREFPLEKITQEVEYLESKGFRAIYITDPILGGKKERSKKVISLLKRLKGSFITAEYRPEYLDEEVMDLLEEAQIGWLEFGLQTTNPDLGYFRRNSPAAMEKLERLSKRAVKFSLDLIVGIPGDTKESFEASLKFAIEKARPTSLKVFPLRFYEGTVLHQMAQKEKAWDYNEKTRVVNKSHTFDKTEFINWLRLGRSSAHLYRFLESNGWFGDEHTLRDMAFFVRFSDKFGQHLHEEYDESQIRRLWGELKNER
mgnify:CR=1 FL=1